MWHSDSRKVEKRKYRHLHPGASALPGDFEERRDGEGEDRGWVGRAEDLWGRRWRTGVRRGGCCVSGPR